MQRRQAVSPDTKALLKILELGEIEIAAGRTKTARSAFVSLRLKQRKWLRENASCIKSYNDFVERYGVYKGIE